MADAQTQAGNGQTAAKAKRETETVEMEDGRKVEFLLPKKEGQKGQQFKKDFVIGETPWDELSSEDKQKANISQAAIRFDFRNGTTRRYPLNPALALQYAGHGGLQKYGDELAGEDAVDLDDWALSTDRLHERLMAGEWTKARIGGGMGGTSVLLQALMEFTGRTAEEVRAHIKDWTPLQKQQLRQDPEIKPIVDKIEAEKAAKATHVDTSALKQSLRGLAA
jgi:hypothetical protein